MAGDVISYGKSDLKSQPKNDSALVEATINPEPKPTDNLSTSTYKWYIIKPKETLFSLSKKSNMTISDLTTLNPKLKQGVLAGDSIKIPGPLLTKLDSTRSIPKLENKLETKIFWQKSSLQAGSEQLQAIADYFKGVQNAIDSIAKNQPRMDVSIKLVSKTDSTFNNETLENAETFLIKPLPNFNEDSLELSSFEFRFLENGVPKSIYVKALPSNAEMRMKMLSFIKSKNANTICLYDDNNSYNVPNIESIIPDITLIKLNRNGTFKPNELRNALDIKKKNYVIIESDKIGVFLSASTILLKELSNFDIQLAVLNQRNIPEESQVSVNRFKILKLIYPMAYNPNFIDKNEITQQIGFMINYDILKRISLQETNAFEKGESEVLGTHFNYILNGNISENKAVSIYMYSENSTAILLGTF